MPNFGVVTEEIKIGTHYDIYIGAMGYEERTTEGSSSLKELNVSVNEAIILEFDMFHEATEKRREKYVENINKITNGKAHRPVSAPTDIQDINLPERIKNLIKTLSGEKTPKIIFDATSFPSIIHSQILRVLLDYKCDLTIIYSEAEEYFPTREEWESGQVKPHRTKVQGPFTGFRYVAKPPILQADDIGELPVLLILFPTFNTERTTGILSDIDPTSRIWIFGEPHDIERNYYRIEMAKTFAGPIMHPGDPWSLVSTFDYRQTLLALGGIYSEYWNRCRLVIMPHGSKMQTFAANLFAATHQISMVFAMPKTYDPYRYSKGCVKVWAISLGETKSFLNSLRVGRAPTNGNV